MCRTSRNCERGIVNSGVLLCGHDLLNSVRNFSLCFSIRKLEKETELECGPMPNAMAALPNIGGALCSTPQSLADAQYYTVSQKRGATLTMAITLSILGGFAKFFHCWKDQ